MTTPLTEVKKSHDDKTSDVAPHLNDAPSEASPPAEDDASSTPNKDLEAGSASDEYFEAADDGGTKTSGNDVNNNNNNNSLINEEATEQHRMNKKSWIALSIAVFLLIVIGVVVGVVVGVNSSNKKAGGAQKHENNVSAPAPQEPQEPKEPVDDNQNNVSKLAPRQAELEDVIEYLVKEGVSSREDLMKDGSPQSLAAGWIVNEDGLDLPVPETDSTTRVGYTYISRYILSLLWFALDGTRWTHQFGDLAELDICEWNEIITGADGRANRRGHYCFRDNGLPGALFLANNDVKGSLPTEIYKMTSLIALDLGFNSLLGSLPSELCVMNLMLLDLAHDEFTGSLPDCMSDMTQLLIMRLSNNGFTEELPDFSKLTNLQLFFLDDNDLSGDLTSSFNEMKDLTGLYIDDNKFSGTINGDFMKGLTSLGQLDISGNLFEGEFPGHLLDLPNLELLDIHDNLLAGPLPTDIAENTVMKFMSFHRNLFSGSLPASLSNLRIMWHLDASDNSFTGDIPGELGNMTGQKVTVTGAEGISREAQFPGLLYLFLSENDFNQGSIPQSFANLTNLEEFSLKSTKRNGTIPDFLGSMSNLTLLDLDNNSLEGEIPTSLGSLADLEFLLVNTNEGINGTVPSTFSGLTSLRMVFLEQTSLTGNLNVLCSLPTFNEPDGDKDGNEIIAADCGGVNPEIECQDGCCDICCTDEEACNDENDAVASLQPEWENSYARYDYDFGSDNATFYDREYVGNS